MGKVQTIRAVGSPPVEVEDRALARSRAQVARLERVLETFAMAVESTGAIRPDREVVWNSLVLHMKELDKRIYAEELFLIEQYLGPLVRRRG